MSRVPLSVYVGFDPREVDGFAVTRQSIHRSTIAPLPVFGLLLDKFREAGMYTRPTSRREVNGKSVMWDDISGAPMATEFAISRFLVPYLATDGFTDTGGLAIFMDSDMLVRADLVHLLEKLTDTSKAVWCVKHNHQAVEGTKMDGQVQTAYARKNWSSVIVFNTDHPSNRKLTLELVNSLPGRDLHRFCWLADEEIGELTPHWNYLVGVNEPIAHPKIVHFTEGLPSMKGYENQPFADEWRAILHEWAFR